MPTLLNQINATVTGASTLVAPSNARRTSVVISTPKTATVWLSFNGAAAVGNGIPLRPGQTPFRLSADDIQDAIHGEITAVSDGVNEVIGVLDFFT